MKYLINCYFVTTEKHMKKLNKIGIVWIENVCIVTIFKIKIITELLINELNNQ